jgi:hypothetical protein
MTPPQALLLALASTYIAEGVIAPHLRSLGSTPDNLNMAQTFVGSALVFRWCKADAALRHVKPVAPVLVALLPPVGLPIYFFKTRPVRKAFGSLGKSVLFLIAMVFLYTCCAILSEKIT